MSLPGTPVKGTTKMRSKALPQTAVMRQVTGRGLAPCLPCADRVASAADTDPKLGCHTVPHSKSEKCWQCSESNRTFAQCKQEASPDENTKRMNLFKARNEFATCIEEGRFDDQTEDEAQEEHDDLAEKFAEACKA